MFKIGDKVIRVLGEDSKNGMHLNQIYTVHRIANTWLIFKNGITETYTKNGQNVVGQNRVLFFSEPKIEAQENPPKYVGKTIFSVDKDDKNKIYGPYVITSENNARVYSNFVYIDLVKFDIYIVDEEEKV